MIKYNHVPKSDYDRIIKVGTRNVACYSKKKLKELFPNGEYSIVAEAGTSSSKSDESLSPEQIAKLDETRVGKIDIAGELFNVFTEGTANKFLNKYQGYVCVGDGIFVAIHESRVPFIITLSSMVAAIIVCLALIVTQLGDEGGSVIVNPDHPLPEVDPNIEKVEDTTNDFHGGTDIEPPETSKPTPGDNTDDPSDGGDGTGDQGDTTVEPIDPDVSQPSSDTEKTDDTTEVNPPKDTDPTDSEQETTQPVTTTEAPDEQENLDINFEINLPDDQGDD